VAWSHNGTHIITGSSDKTVTIWDPKAGKILRMLKGHQDTVKSCVFSPVQQDNGITVAASAGGYSCMLWNPLAPNQNCVQDLRQHQEGKEVECVDISSSGQLIATGGRDGVIMVSNVPQISKYAAKTEADAKASDKPKWGRPAESEDWAEAVRVRKAKMLEMNKPKGPVSKQPLTRVPDGKEPSRPWQRKQAATKAEKTKAEAEPLKPWQRRMLEKQAHSTPAPVNSKGTKTAGDVNPMIQQAEKAKPTGPSKISDPKQFMQSLKARTDARAEPVKEVKWKPPAQVAVEKVEPMDGLMQGPVTIGKKVKLRQFSIKEPSDFRAKQGSNQGRDTPTSDAFANY